MITSIGVVVAFQTSANLAAAYGVAVCVVMVLTTALYGVALVVHFRTKWPVVLLFVAAYGLIDGAFLSASLLKFVDGGWFPLALASVLWAVMMVWRWGRRQLKRALEASAWDDSDLFARSAVPAPEDAVGTALDSLDSASALTERSIHAERGPPATSGGVFICFSSSSDKVPAALTHLARCIPFRPSLLVFCTVSVSQEAHVDDDASIDVARVASSPDDVFRAVVTVGYAQPLPECRALTAAVLQRARGLVTTAQVDSRAAEVDVDDGNGMVDTVTYVMGRDTVVPSAHSGRLRTALVILFAVLMRLSRAQSFVLGVPPSRLIEVGMCVEL